MAGTKRAANNKTKPEKASAADFIANIKDDDVRKDCQQIVKLMRRVTGEKPVMWGASMVGFGQYHYVYPSGREGDYFLTGFSPRNESPQLPSLFRRMAVSSQPSVIWPDSALAMAAVIW